jgi:hypothetical protein
VQVMTCLMILCTYLQKDWPDALAKLSLAEESFAVATPSVLELVDNGGSVLKLSCMQEQSSLGHAAHEHPILPASVCLRWQSKQLPAG